jgi:mRNA interferase HicA
MVEAVELKRRIQSADQARRVAWRLVRQGGRHEVWQCGSTKVTIPRHREINEITARAILKTLEAELGLGWWRR